MRRKSDADLRGFIFAMFVICLLLLGVVVVDGGSMCCDIDTGEELPCSELDSGLDLVENRSSNKSFEICRNLSSGESVLCKDVGGR